MSGSCCFIIPEKRLRARHGQACAAIPSPARAAAGTSCVSKPGHAVDAPREGGMSSVGELLEKMRGCVDTYASRLKNSKTMYATYLSIEGMLMDGVPETRGQSLNVSKTFRKLKDIQGS